MNQPNAKIEFTNGEKYIFVPINRLMQLKDEIDLFKTTEQLNGFQNWIVNDFYQFELPKSDFTIRSVLLIAIPHPLFSKVTLSHNGKKYTCLSLVSSDFDNTKNTLNTVFQTENIHSREARNLPLKRLAVHSGLATYGKNNVTYIDGLGSNFSYLAYFTDIAGSESQWVDVNHSSQCDTCALCADNCPTGAIQKDTFLIDNQRCLSCMNESGDPFPEWLPKSAHHTLYDCLQCQLPCPMNREQLKKTGEYIEFAENETAILLAGTRYDAYPETMKKKAKYLGIHQWPDGIAKNVRVLMESIEGKQ